MITKFFKKEVPILPISSTIAMGGTSGKNHPFIEATRSSNNNNCHYANSEDVPRRSRRGLCTFLFEICLLMQFAFLLFLLTAAIALKFEWNNLNLSSGSDADSGAVNITTICQYGHSLYFKSEFKLDQDSAVDGVTSFMIVIFIISLVTCGVSLLVIRRHNIFPLSILIIIWAVTVLVQGRNLYTYGYVLLNRLGFADDSGEGTIFQLNSAQEEDEIMSLLSPSLGLNRDGPGVMRCFLQMNY